MTSRDEFLGVLRSFAGWRRHNGLLRSQARRDWVPCPIGCGFTHDRTDPDPPHSVRWLEAQLAAFTRGEAPWS